MTKSPEHIVTDNQYGIIFMGPAGEGNKVGDGADYNMVISLKSDYNLTHTLKGNKGEVVPGCSHEIVGINLSQGRNDVESEIVSKSITAENGDIVLNAENGNIKLKAKNIYVETFGSESDGSILMKANDHISIVADEQVNIGGGKVCVTSADSITFNAKGYLRLLYADVIQGSPLNGILNNFIPEPVAKLITDIAETCK